MNEIMILVNPPPQLTVTLHIRPKAITTTIEGPLEIIQRLYYKTLSLQLMGT